jgi:DNA-binding protein WhiA
MADAPRVDLLDEFLATNGFPARKVSRGKKIGLYYKKNAEIEELFSVMGAVHATLDLINLVIKKEIRNNENRATNCVAKNIARTVDAVAKQMEAIEKLRDHGVLDGLSDDLRTTGELRLKYDEASLSELASYHLPPISKSGLNHRLSRLMEMAEKLK